MKLGYKVKLIATLYLLELNDVAVSFLVVQNSVLKCLQTHKNPWRLALDIYSIKFYYEQSKFYEYTRNIN